MATKDPVVNTDAIADLDAQLEAGEISQRQHDLAVSIISPDTPDVAQAPISEKTSEE